MCKQFYDNVHTRSSEITCNSIQQFYDSIHNFFTTECIMHYIYDNVIKASNQNKLQIRIVQIIQINTSRFKKVGHIILSLLLRMVCMRYVAKLFLYQVERKRSLKAKF